MAERHICRALALAFLLGCGAETGELGRADTDLARLLPAPSTLEGWTAAVGPVEYLPETLYEYLDGAAPRYLVYGFRRLIHVRYELGDDLLASVTLDAFDMGNELGAFGIYRSGVPPSAPAREWGVEGHRSGTVAAAWQGNVYVQAEADDDRPALIGMLERLVARVCAEVAGDTSLPAILEPLPSDGLIPRSERYVGADLLGHAFLPGGVLATYDIGSHEARAFFSDLESEVLATRALDQFRTHQTQWGAVVRDVASIGVGGFQFSDPGLGSGIVVRTRRFVAGVYGDLPNDAQDRLLDRLVVGLSSLEAAH
jgi:hypothetical protein